MSEAYQRYIEASFELFELRKRGITLAREDLLLEAMDDLWWEMTQEERDEIDEEAARSGR